MAFTTMHFAVGMAGAGSLASAVALVRWRGWRWLPLAMTAGGIWACVPDMPRVFRIDFPFLGFADSLGSKSLEKSLHHHGDWFFFHRMLDAQPKEFALHGLLGILVFYTASVFFMALTLRRRERQVRRLIRAAELAAEQQAGSDTPAPTPDTADDTAKRAA